MSEASHTRHSLSTFLSNVPGSNSLETQMLHSELPPQSRTSGFPASGSSDRAFARFVEIMDDARRRQRMTA